MIQISKINEALARVSSTDDGAMMELYEYFSFYADGYKFIPAYRNKMWDGKIRLFRARDRILPYGLIPEAVEFARKYKYKIGLSDDIKSDTPPAKADLVEFAKSLDIRSGGKVITPRDYQIDAFIHSVMRKRAIVVSPTGSGKSLIIYMLIRWYLDNFDDKVIIVVPTTSLVEQMYKDFDDYSSNDREFSSDEDVHRIYSGKERDGFSQRVVVTTWQSAIKMPKSWFREYGMVVGDEAHNFKAKSLNTIMEAFVNASVRIGTTGTLDGIKVNELVLIGNFGPVFKVITTKSLIDSKTLAPLEIKCLVIKHDEVLKKAVIRMDYQSEISTIIEHPRRNKLITQLAADQKGNTLVLFNRVGSHGKPLFESIGAAVADDPDRVVHYVSGEVGAEAREEIRALTDADGAGKTIIVASSGVFSTGINIKNLEAIIFAAPTKSQIRVLQSIGRGLRRSGDKKTIIYDLADDFSWKKKKNYTLLHAIDRVKIYAKEGFDFKMFEIPMKVD